jgi:membrane protein DedA with SNARE-associated domain
MDWLVHGIEWILGGLLTWIHAVIEALGYVGVALLMAIESANIPLPSEMILPYAGYLVQQGQMNIHWASLAGALGCVLGSLPCYALGRWGGEAFIQKYGKWVLIDEDDLKDARRWTARFGDAAFFICRMLPIVRTFISVPAGVLKAHFWRFTLYTFIGSWVWSYLLVYVGIVFGNNLKAFKHYWHQFDVAIALVLLLGGGYYLWKHVAKKWMKHHA